MIHKAIDFYIKKSEFKKSEVGLMLNTDRANITRLCQPKANPTFGTLIDLAKVLKIKVSDLALKAEEFKKCEY